MATLLPPAAAGSATDDERPVRDGRRRVRSEDAAPPPCAVSLRVTGVVQGVGFRPFVHRLATRRGLAGWVRNDGAYVDIALEGGRDAVASFVHALRAEAPPLARIDAVQETAADVAGHVGFTIRPSDALAPDFVHASPPRVAPDVATCDACARELRDPGDRRHAHAFVTCTDCGPRYTIVDALPYDRARTSMGAFAPCPRCAAEYETPGERRHHAETLACPACGPRLAFVRDDGGALAPTDDARSGDDAALDAAARVLRDGGVLAVRGIGGFHLACDATSEAAVARLRARKRRDAKPLAVMVASLDEARALAEPNDDEARWLASRERPIVLVRRRASAPLARGVAPELERVGIMLAYAPVQHLLLARAGVPLVMTSGNLSDEPIAAGVDEGRTRLAGIADAFLLHDRTIVAPLDDSVARTADGGLLLFRRARGWAPLPVPLPVPADAPVLAVGPHLKNTFTLARGADAFVSPHLGDLDSLEGIARWRQTLAHWERLFDARPARVAHDLHPGYLSTRLALELSAARGLPVTAVQHHHAHAAAVLAEHGHTAPAVVATFDGTGHGDDGRTWGGEILLADLAGYRRVARLRWAPLPGGDRAARSPWRCALGYASLDAAAAPLLAGAWDGVADAEHAAARAQLAAGFNAPLASSMGRLFDAAAAILGVCRDARFEGDAAMRLEALAGAHRAEPLPFPATRTRDPDGERWVLDPLPLLAALAERTRAGVAPALLAAAFHESVAAATADVMLACCDEAGVRTTGLSGGSFQNARLLESVARRLRSAGLRVLVPRRLPPNDGAISYGQAVVAIARSRT